MKNNIKKFRQDLKLSQQKLAEQSKISRPYLSDIEREKKNPSIDVILRISAALKRTIDDIFLQQVSS